MSRSLFSYIFIVTVLTTTSSFSQFVPIAIWNSSKNLIFNTSPLTFLTKTCSPGITVQSSYSSGTPFIVNSDTTINITSHVGLTLYSDQYCTQLITDPVILSGNSATTFYVINQNANTINLKATHSSYVENHNDNQDHTFTNTNYLWTGGGNPDSIWSTGANWSGGVAPGVSDVAIFDSTCVINCSPSTNGVVDIAGLRMELGYSGTITQGAFNFTVRSGHFVQLAGSFVGDTTGTATLYAYQSGGLIIDGGTMTFSAFETKVSGNYRASTIATITAPTNSTFAYWCNNTTEPCHNLTHTLEPGNVAYENLVFHGARSSPNFLGGTWTVNKDLTTGDSVSVYGLYNGTIDLYGNLYTQYQGSTGSAVIRLRGNAAGQTITADLTEDDHLPRIQIEAGANSVTLSGYVTATGWNYISAGSLVTTGSTLKLNCTSGTIDWCFNVVDSDWNLGTVTYNNVIFKGNRTYINLQGATWKIDGNLTLGDSVYQTSYLNNGRIELKGDLTLTHQGFDGNATIELVGNPLGQTISEGTSTQRLLPHIEINTGTNPVTISGRIRPYNWTYISSGTFNVSGSTLELVVYSANPGSNSTVNPTFGSVAYNNLSFQGFNTNWDLTGETVIVEGTLSFGDFQDDDFGSTEELIGGTIEAYGDITEVNYGYKGTTLINVKGNILGQTITGMGGYFPAIQIDAGANNVNLVGDIDVEDYTYLSSGIFNAGSSSLRFLCKSTFNCYSTTQSPIFGNVSYYHLWLVGSNTDWDLLGQTVNINGSLTLFDRSSAGKRIDNGTLSVGFNVLLTGDNKVRGNAVIKLTGRPSGQVINCGTGTLNRTPVLRLDTGINKVDIDGDCTPDGWEYISSGALTGLTNSNLNFNVDSGHPWESNSVTLDFGSSASFYNLTFEGRDTDFDISGNTIKVSNQFNTGDLTTIGQSINNLSVNLDGDLHIDNFGQSGNMILSFVGTGNQTIDGSGSNFPSGLVTIDKPSGLLTFNNSLNLTSPGQNFTLHNGTVDMNGFNLIVNDTITIEAGTTLTQNGGTLSYNTLVQNGTLNP